MCVTNNITEKSLEKWKDLILACKNYYIDSVPTGMDDAVYDMLEARAAQEDGFFCQRLCLSNIFKRN